MDDSYHDAVSRRELLLLSSGLAVAAASRARIAEAQAGAGTTTKSKTICVLGASGNVGNAVVHELIAAGHRVAAVSRSAKKLDSIRTALASTNRIEIIEGDVSSDRLAAELRENIQARIGEPDVIVASLSAPEADKPMRMLDTATDKIRGAFDTNFFTHVAAAHALIPALTRGGVYVGINGGLADAVIPNMGALSMTQSALRSLYSVLAQETQDAKARIRLLEIHGLVATEHRPAQSGGQWITDQQVRERVAEIIRRPEALPGPILAIKAEKYR